MFYKKHIILFMIIILWHKPQSEREIELIKYVVRVCGNQLSVCSSATITLDA